ncbi:MAG: transposase [Candidatus Omnitrophica bacterium]|nr:transposase [Candidatus Omnitrophota bacterium]
MARALRILFAGAHYHVINRGQGRRAIFLDEKDNKTFLNILSKACETYKVNIVAYCLMKNHYHLIVHTPEANLSAFMRQLNGVYTQVFNQRYKHDGPLFKGRYKAIVVQAGSYLLRLIRYVHKNPERAGIANKCKGGLYTSHEAFDSGKESDWLKFKYVLKNQNKVKVDLIYI